MQTPVVKVQFNAELVSITKDEIHLKGNTIFKVMGEMTLDDLDEISLSLIGRFAEQLAEHIYNAKKNMNFLS